jgi:long-subunit fatty acid transport protein
VKVDLFSKQVDAQVIDAHLAAHVAPVFGLQVRPLSRLRFGLTYRYEMSLKYEIPATIDLEGIGSLAFEAHGYTHYSPHTFVLGAAFEPHEDLTISLDGELALWEFAPSPYLGMTMDLSGETLEALGLGDALDLAQDPPAPGFTNTLGVKLGVEYRLSKRFAARAGFMYRPTPVPKQNVERTNILDGSAVGVSVGGGFNFDDPLEIFQSPIHIDLSAQGQFMIGREATKDPLDAMPSYSYVGRTFGVSSALRYDF